MFLTYRYRFRPSRAQYAALERILEMQRILYNASLQERIDSWKHGRALAALRGADRPDPKLDPWKPVTRYGQYASLTAVRADDPQGYGALPANLLRDTVNRVDRAFKGFFSRLKERNGRAGFPRFKPMGRWKSFGFAEFSGIRLTGPKLHFSGICGGLKVRMHRPLPDGAEIRACTFTRVSGRWSVSLQIELPDAQPIEGDARPWAGLDGGIEKFAALSDGTSVENPRTGQKRSKARRRLERQVARCERGSKRRRKAVQRLARLRRREADARRTFLHQVSARLAAAYALVAVEGLSIRNMTRSARGTAEEPGRNVRAKSGLNREMLDVAFATFVAMLSYKAGRAGGRVVKVDPRWTSQDCSGCGRTVPKGLGVRTHRCGGCGLVLDRDVNAARNILAKAVVGLEDAKQAVACSS